MNRFCNALKISWIKRLKDENNNGFWQQHVLIGLDRFGGNYIWSSHFLRNVLEAWQIYAYESPVSALACGNQGLWRNSFIKVGQKTVLYKKWLDKDIRFVRDLLSKAFQRKYNLTCNILQYYGLSRAIRSSWKQLFLSIVRFSIAILLLTWMY